MWEKLINGSHKIRTFFLSSEKTGQSGSLFTWNRERIIANTLKIHTAQEGKQKFKICEQTFDMDNKQAQFK